VTLVIDEEFGSHLVMINSAFSIVSSVTDLESLWEEEEGVERVENEEENEHVLEDAKKWANIPLVAATLFGVSDRTIEP
jgi:hypothetical protein